jgi:alkylation response protein AidB-like acyl-CoA dehydrogenase
MHIGDSPEEAAFRAECRSWLEDNATLRTGSPRNVHGGGPGALALHMQACSEWQKVLHDHGWAGIAWPKVFGGRGGTPMQAAIWAEEMGRFDVPTGAFSVSIGMVAPTLMVHGTTEQRTFLDPILRGEQVWCQLFSEPGAGSDLAGLGTRAIRDGDEWVVNGQKVWTSFGQFADYGILLARTDPDVPKHAGITYFIVDMKTPGIEVRPLVQITGVAHFNEVFLTDVRIPVANVVGEINGGWKIANTTLGSERALIGGGGGSWSVPELIALAQRMGVNNDPTIRQELVQAHIRASVLSYFGLRMRTALSKGTMPGSEGSVMKLAFAQHWARTTDTAMKVLGAGGMLADEDAADHGAWQDSFLGQYAVRLGGGTDEVQHNVIGERALGLPREPSNDRDVAWKDLAKA